MDFHNNADRLPPQNLEAEEAILGGILLDPAALPRVMDVIKPEMFYLRQHGEIYKTACLLYAENKPTDIPMMVEKLGALNLLEQIGGRNKLATLVDRTVSAVNIDAMAELVAEKYLRRQLIKSASEITFFAYQEDKDLQECLSASEGRIVSLRTQIKSEGITHISNTLVERFQELEKRNLGLLLPGIQCGFYDLDAMTSGFQRGDLIVLGARPSMGKTSFAMNVALNIAALQKLPVVFFSFEQSKDQLVDRLLGSEAGVEMGYLRSGRISVTQWEPISKAIATLSEMPIHIYDSVPNSLQEIRTNLSQFVNQNKDLGLVVVDYLGLLEPYSSGGTQNERIAKISLFLKNLAKEFKVPVIALSQLSRKVEERTNKRPMMSDLRDSGAVEQDADLILFLYRDEYYNSESPEAGIAELIIAKHRNGPTGTVKLLFDSQFTKFKNLARPNSIPKEIEL